MRRIDQQWGVARALLGLGDLARLRGDPGGAHSRYLETLAILRDIDARPDMARCLAGLARVAMDLGSMGQARQHLAESIRLSHSTGSRIGVARGLEAFASLAVREDRPELAVQLTAAATALREAAGYPELDGARRERYLAPARRLLGKPAVERLWAQGRALSSEAAVALALDEPQAASGDAVAAGRSNKSIAEELFISPATAARHVANILGKLGFSSRAQIAAWAADNQVDRAGPMGNSAGGTG